jgi:hypothetical protein
LWKKSFVKARHTTLADEICRSFKSVIQYGYRGGGIALSFVVVDVLMERIIIVIEHVVLLASLVVRIGIAVG